MPLMIGSAHKIDKDRTIAIGDFNISDTARLLPKFCEEFFDVFDGVETRPNSVKTDRVFCQTEHHIKTCIIFVAIAMIPTLALIITITISA